jgi:EmrB/QacA subfamily drug resistance transporter
MVARMQAKWWTLVAVCVAIFMLLLDITVVNVALPSIQHDLGASFSDLQWVVDAYALMLAAALLPAGSIADLAGRRRVFVAGLGLFTLASLLCGLAQTPLQLHLARGLQGIGGAVMFATSLALLANAFHGKERGTAFGIWGATTGAAVAIGPLVGGAVTDSLGWEWIFFLNIPIGIVAGVMTVRYVAESKNPATSRLDIPGALTFSAGLFALVYALITGNSYGWDSTRIVTWFAAAAVLLLAFLLLQWKGKTPMFDLALFRVPTFVGASIAALTLSASIFAMLLYITLYLQQYLGFEPLQAGLRLLPISLLSFVFSAFSGSMSERLSVRWLMFAGLAITAVGLVLLGGRDPGDAWTAMLPGLLLCGVGIGLVNPPLASMSIAVVQPQRSGMASGINSTFRQVGIALGIAVLGAVFEHHAGNEVAAAVSHSEAFVESFNRILIIAAGTAAVGAIASLVLVRRKDVLHASQ